MKRLLACAGFLLAALLARSQSISPEVIASAGGHFGGAGVELSWTLGEMIIETIGGGTTTLTQGFHQVDNSINAVPESFPSLLCTAFPNPASTGISLQFSEQLKENTIAEIYSLEGKLVWSGQVLSGSLQTQIDLSILSLGAYQLRLHNTSQTFHTRIIKH